jgi:hypothetical protein
MLKATKENPLLRETHKEVPHEKEVIGRFGGAGGSINQREGAEHWAGNANPVAPFDHKEHHQAKGGGAAQVDKAQPPRVLPGAAGQRLVN